MPSNAERPGVSFIVCGAVFYCPLASRLFTDWGPPGPEGAVFVAVFCVIGASLQLWGWLQLRRAKAERPDLTWWQFVGTEVIAVGILLALFAVFAALPREKFDEFRRAVDQFTQWVNIARGHP